MVGVLSDIGNYRSINQDSVGYIEDDDKKLYIIADGMGGHNAGEVASKIAVDSTIEYIKNSSSNENLDKGKMFIDSIKYANIKIYDEALKDERLMGMGTTITACYIEGSHMLIANVGDSSCYVVSSSQIKKITKDHSLVQQLIDNGSITEEEAVSHPNKNIITRALGIKKDVDVDLYRMEISSDMKVVLCTDGLTNYVTKDEIFNIVNNNNNKKACEKLIELSKRKNGRDNISVIAFGGCDKGDDKDDR